MADDMPPIVTRLTADVTGLAEGLLKGRALLQEWKQQVAADFNGGRASGERLGKDLGDGLERGIQDAVPSIKKSADTAGSDTGQAFGRAMLAKMYPASYGSGEQVGKNIGDGISKGVEPGLDDAGKKIKDKTERAGKDAGAAAGQGMSPLIIGALAGAGAIGGPLLVAGVGAAMVGATALILRQNQVISADFTRVSKDAVSEIQQAAAPLAGTLNQALIGVDKQVKAMEPDLKNLFGAAQPEITDVTSGLTGLVGNTLPGLSSALTRGRVIVSDFSQSLPVLGSDVGRFFNGLVQNASLEGRALQSTLNTVGNTVDTLGTLLGDSATAASGPLITLTHVVNGLDDAIRTVSSPATVGALGGLFGAIKFDPALSSGLKNASTGLAGVAEKAATSGGALSKVAGFVSGASGALGKMADVMGGPWGLAIGGGLGLLSGLTSQLGKADDATQAFILDTGKLADAVSQDGAKAGQATAAYITQQAQVSGLADEAKNAGVSLVLLTQAATGNQAAMSQLTSITGAANEVSRQQQAATAAQLEGQQQMTSVQQRNSVAVNTLYSSTVQLASGQQQLNTQFTTGATRLTQGLAASNSMTTANQQLLNSVRAQTQQVADEIEKQAQLNAATNALNNSTNIFNATLDAAHQKQVQSAQAKADDAIAALNLGTGQTTLNQSLAASVQQYQQAVGGAQAYDTTLTAVTGTMNTLLGAEASFTIALDGVTKAAQSNGRSLDVTDTKGAQNIQTFTGLATSAQKAADAVYQSEVSTKGASVAYQDANAKLSQEKQAFIDAADKAGFNKKQVKALADELYALPKTVPVTIQANTSPALQSVNAFIEHVDSSSGVVQIYTSGVSAAGGKALTYDSGGFVDAPPGRAVPATVHGQEYVLSQDMLAGRQRVDPRVLAALRSGGGIGPAPAPAAASSGSAGFGSDAPVTVYAPIYLDGKLIGQSVTRGSRSSAQQYKNRNSQTGFN